MEKELEEGDDMKAQVKVCVCVCVHGKGCMVGWSRDSGRHEEAVLHNGRSKAVVNGV